MTRNDNDRHLSAVRGAIEHKYNGRGGERVIYTESHDEVANGKTRVPEAVTPGDAASWWAKKRSILGSALVLTSPGNTGVPQAPTLLYLHGNYEDLGSLADLAAILAKAAVDGKLAGPVNHAHTSAAYLT